jgi:hypothetical protein
VSASPGASPTGNDDGIGDADVADVQSRVQQALGAPDMAGLEGLLLDHVSLSTPNGGSVMDSAQAASWLRDHAGTGISVVQVTRGTQDVMLQVMTDGWPHKDPIQTGRVTFSLRRYDANGRQDQSGGGDWKIDVIEVE